MIATGVTVLGTVAGVDDIADALDRSSYVNADFVMGAGVAVITSGVASLGQMLRLGQRIEKVEAGLRENTGAVRENTHAINEMRTDIKDMRTDIKDMRTDIKDMRTDIRGMKSGIDALVVNTDRTASGIERMSAAFEKLADGLSRDKQARDGKPAE